MHVLQYIAVQAESEDIAVETVEGTLSTELDSEDSGTDSWFDGFVIGGSISLDGEPDASDSNQVINYAKNPQEFLAVVDSLMSKRNGEFAKFRKDVDLEKLTSTLQNYDPSNHDVHALAKIYALKKCMDIILGVWDSNSYFYDIQNSSVDAKWMKETLDLQGDEWFLVPVDFHF